MSNTRTSACPSCGAVAERTLYDIGSGPELSCASCEWCWGADGQSLKQLKLSDILLHGNPFENKDKEL